MAATREEAVPHPAIQVRGARTHNLKNVDCRIPHGRLTVVTGLSGAGKSSLAFDTIYAEGQRRFVESISTYARQFLRQMERPPVDEVCNVLPAVALEAKNTVRNARSTVATLSELADVLRLLYTHLGEVRCPEHDLPARAMSVDEIVTELATGGAGERFVLAASVPRPKRAATIALRELVRQGYRRRWRGGEIETLNSRSTWTKDQSELTVVVAKLTTDSSPERLAGAVEEALALGRGRLELLDLEGGGRRFLATSPACPSCGRDFVRPQPALFSFNSPLGACSTCQGFGRVIGVDRRRVVPDEDLTLESGAIAPWTTDSKRKYLKRLLAACAEEGVPTDRPWRELSAGEREFVWSGTGDFVNLDRFFRRLERKSYRVHVRVLLARYRSYDACPDCGGSRLKPAARAVFVRDAPLAKLMAMSVGELAAWVAGGEWSDREREVGARLLEELERRVGILERVGLDYLTLDRQARTLSGGEIQRIQLAAALGSGLTSTLYVLDEPTVGLHPADSGRLVSILRALADRGNTVLVVEHDRTVIERADHVIDLGPVAGEKGGEVVAEGTVEEIAACPESATGKYLRRLPTDARRHVERFRRERRRPSGERRARGASGPSFRVEGARAHNLQCLDVEFPQNALVAVTGVSGSGKSTLVENVIYANLAGRKRSVDQERGAVTGLFGFEGLEDVVLVDQRPLGRSKRSNPATSIKAYDEIRKLFAATPSARRRGITAGHFSFNVNKGRCPVCEGSGEVEVDMQFMAPVTIPCDECQGRRFRPEILTVRFRDLTVAETLDLSVDGALEHFAAHPRLCRRLQLLADAGLGYLRLGQPTSTLSGGEAQRLKLASFLGERASDKSRLFLFDEPTTGLHFADIDLLSRTLGRLVEAGHSVLVVEHSSDFIARCDWVVDLGPGGGHHGGRLVFSGPVSEFLRSGEGATADELRRHVRWHRSDGAGTGDTLAAAG